MTLEEAITPGQTKQFVRLLEDAAWKALEKVDFNRDDLQLVIEHGDKLQKDIVWAIEELVTWVYSGGYHPKSITEQTNILRQYFSGIGYANEKIAKQPLPEGAEGSFAIPRWKTIGPTYNEAVRTVLKVIRKQRNLIFEEQRKDLLLFEKEDMLLFEEDKLGTQYLRQHEHKVRKLQILAEKQEGYDILVVPAQFGLLHKGFHVDEGRTVFAKNEFGLGAYEVAIMLLTHPERLVAYRNLWIDCPGDETVFLGKKSDFSAVPCFTVERRTKQIKFWPGLLGSTNVGYGTATGFLLE